jgi:diacylglycerol kinase family enzyme
MRVQVILNRDGGTLRTLDLGEFEAETRRVLEEAGHEVVVKVIGSDDLDDTLKEALDAPCDVVMVGGGDGTISAAASVLEGSDKALAVLPAGTMNLFARSLGIPLDLAEAVAAFANGKIRKVDLAEAGGEVFVHQFSIGLHAKVIRLREKHQFSSRVGKMWASVRASMRAIFRPPSLKVELTIDGVRSRRRTAGVGISNNIFGEGHMPYTDTPDGGVLGVYVTRVRRPRDIARMMIQVARGKWKENDTVEVSSGQEVIVRLLSRHERFGCAIDGEIRPLDTVTELRIHPGALTVLVPESPSVS